MVDIVKEGASPQAACSGPFAAPMWSAGFEQIWARGSMAPPNAHSHVAIAICVEDNAAYVENAPPL